MSSMVPLPAKALAFSNTSDNADLLKRVMLQLGKKKVSGYLRIQNKDAEGYLFLRHGKAFNSRFCADVNADHYLIGKDAAKALNRYCYENSHHLFVYLLDPKITDVIAAMATGRDRHKRLHTQFVDILKFTRHLSDSGFSGYMHVHITSMKRCAICLYKTGRAKGCILYPIEGFEVITKLAQWEFFLSEAQERGAVFSVFEPVQTSWDSVKFGFIPKASAHMHFLHRIFEICENAFKSNNSPSSFEELFVDACIQVTDQYPFMHPFGNEVQYEQGKLKIKNDLEFTTVLNGLNAVLKEIFQLAGRAGKSILADVKSQLEEQADNYETNELKKFIEFLPTLFNGETKE
jgi:hypothetical protein